MFDLTARTPEQMYDYYSMPWRRKAGTIAGVGFWQRGWLVVLDDDRHAILERHLRGTWLRRDTLRFSGYAFTDWSDPLRYLEARDDSGGFLPNEYLSTGDITEMDDGLFVFTERPYQRREAKVMVGTVLSSLLYLRAVRA